jgi:hypothetical protein
VNGNSTVRVQVGRGADQAVAHVRLHALGAFADRLGVGDALSGRRVPRRDRGKVLAMLMLAPQASPKSTLSRPGDALAMS